MKNIKIVGVVGAGTMGSGLAQKFAQEGFEVVLVDRGMQYIDKGISNIKATLEEGVKRRAKIGLRWRKGPIDLMKFYGDDAVKQYIENILAPMGRRHASGRLDSRDWDMEYVTSSKTGSTVVITMARPEDMNALNEKVIQQLDNKFSEADADPDVDTIFITGLGKAFVAGADIRFFVKNMKANAIDNILEFTKYGQHVFRKIDESNKQVVAVLNGMALGGGLELALCADQILATPKASVAFPETGIGIYPGLGGTQRASQRAGKGIAKYLILTGKMLSAQDALEVGLIDSVIRMEEMFDILEGQLPVPAAERSQAGEKWQKIAGFYEQNSYRSIVKGEFTDGGLDDETIAKLAKTMSFKAPLAMDAAEQLIEEAKDPESELQKLTMIFGTSDALLGLTSIGKRVEFEGR